MCHNENHVLILFVFTGWKVTEEQLEEVAQLSDVLACHDDFLSPDLRAKCEQIIPDPLALDVSDCAHASITSETTFNFDIFPLSLLFL